MRACILFTLCAIIAACTPKQRAEINIEVHREGLTSLELLLLTADEQELTRCRVYPSSTTTAPDACPLEDGTDTWSGERRIGDAALSLLVYGDIESSSISASITGFIGNREVVSARSNPIVFSPEGTTPTRLILPDVTAVHQSCAVEFSNIAGVANFQSGPALNMIPSSTGYDLLFAGAGRLTRYQFDKASNNTSDCSIKDVNTRTLALLCNVRADQLVVGPMSVLSEEPKEYAALLCESGGMNPNAGVRVIFAEYSAQTSDSDAFISRNLGDSSRLQALSPLVMSDFPSVDDANSFDVFAHYASTSTSANPVLRAVKFTLERNAPAEELHQFRQVRPVIQCADGTSCMSRSLPTCRQGRLQVLSQGCVQCRARDSFSNPDLVCDSETETLFQRTSSSSELECLPKNQCAYEQNLDGGINRVVAPYPPLFSELADNTTGMFTLGYSGGLGFRLSETGGTQERQVINKASIFQPSIINEEGMDSLLIQDTGLTATRNMRLTLSNLNTQQNQLSRPARISSLYQDLNYPGTYAIGKTAGDASPFAVFGEFYLRRVFETNEFETVLTVFVQDLDSSSFESQIGIRTATISFSNASPSNGVHGVATILLGNIDADPSDTELVVYQPEFGRQIHAFKMKESSLEPIEGFPLALTWREVLDEPRALSVLMSDLDKDGALEIVAADKSQLQIFSLGIDSYDRENLSWPMARRDRQNSSRFTTARDPHSD